MARRSRRVRRVRAHRSRRMEAKSKPQSHRSVFLALKRHAGHYILFQSSFFSFWRKFDVQAKPLVGAKLPELQAMKQALLGAVPVEGEEGRA